MLRETIDKDTYLSPTIINDDNLVSSLSTTSSSASSASLESFETNSSIRANNDQHVDDDDNVSVANNNNQNGGNGQSHFFEGAEKRLAIYFREEFDEEDDVCVGENGVDGENHHELAPSTKRTNKKTGSLDLRKITRSQWKNILDLVHCRIVNVITNEYYDAYLLSESSLFVSERSLMIKTCGSTTLLNCLDAILNVVFKLGYDSIVENVFYSHKNLLLPSLQTMPHHSFVKENEFLDKLFNGNSHLFGHINSDRWYLYKMDHYRTEAMNGNGHPNIDNEWMDVPERHPQPMVLNDNEHFKFEMIMENLDAEIMRLFYQDPVKPKTAVEVTHKSGIDSIIPGMIIDDYLFSPCGYSMNGLLGKYFMTIHITPEPEFSYVSVETNVPQKSYSDFIEKLIKIFRPGKFMLNLFVPSINYLKTKQEFNNMEDVLSLNSIGHALGTNGNDHKKLQAGAVGAVNYFEKAAQMHGLMIYEAFSCCNGFNKSGTGSGKLSVEQNGDPKQNYRRCDFQMAHNENLDIIYARYVSKGFS